MAMMHLAAYDVHEDQRRAQLSALLQAYGDRIQYSVFLLGITPEELVEIQSRAAGIIDENTDSLWIVRQCAACWEEARTLGQAHPPARVLHYLAERAGRRHEGRVGGSRRSRLPAAGGFGDTLGQGCWRTTKNSLRCVWHLTRGFTPFRAGSAPWLEGVRRGGV